MKTRLLSILALSIIWACDPETPAPENEEEIITDVKLTFTPSSGGSPVVVNATDPDGEGPGDIQVSGTITLDVSTLYTLTIEASNSIAGTDITEEINEEAEEHMFFFGWTDGLFSDPTGDGNIDNRADDMNYGDQDADLLPLGLTTTWTTGLLASSGEFRLILKHQPGLKSATSTSEDGETDLDLTWNLAIQ